MSRWAISPYSKGQVNRAGNILIDLSATDAQRQKAMEVLSSWRASHAYPMHALLMMLRNKAPEIDGEAIVVQRHKRAPSIIEKLSRIPGMQLSRMQDIGGCRAILSNVGNVEELNKIIQSSRIRHKLHREYNYINDPKPDGYRGIHLVYKYHGDKTEYEDYFVELQLRSKAQHAWSTAVEIVDTFTGQSIKTGRGDQKWRSFFLMASAEFAKIEDRPVGCHVSGIDTRSELSKLIVSLHIPDLLKTYADLAQHLNELAKKHKESYDYFLLELDHVKKFVNVITYGRKDVNLATQDYLERETALKDNPDYDTVLVAASSLDALRHAYPNYFADSTAFLEYIEMALHD